MKLSLAALVFCTLAVTAQDYPTDQLKRLSVPTLTSVRPVSVVALHIERTPEYPSIVHLKGSVEIKMPVCVAAGRVNAHLCDGYVVLHADEADFHEDSGQIDARGNVTVTREK
jgi:lipopolysaccharide assembly outer membrane protein LptD (OstA)